MICDHFLVLCPMEKALNSKNETYQNLDCSVVGA
uniref:Uncharacterized protein n=1 Tax=Rhizophora mucronata TaxID=61149 RepID=A0A2P2IPG3_RHIMU